MAQQGRGGRSRTDEANEAGVPGVDAREVLARNVEQQAAVYGEPLGSMLGRIGEQLGLTQTRMAAVLGLSAPMLSQLMSAHRIKIGNPVALQRLQALAGLGNGVAAGQVPLVAVEARLAEISARGSVVTDSTASSATANPSTGGVATGAASARTVQVLFRAVASAEELLGAAALVADRYPEIAILLRTYGAGRTSEAVAHFEAHAD